MPPRGAATNYRATVTFRAPLSFVYRWCTDYTPQDARYENEEYERRIVRRTAREVVYEDLEASKEGWHWARHVVELLPPDRWHSRSIGNRREYDLDYRLRELPEGRTELTLRARRRPYGIGGPNPTVAEWDANIQKVWAEFGRSLERDYRKSVRSARRA